MWGDDDDSGAATSEPSEATPAPDQTTTTPDPTTTAPDTAGTYVPGADPDADAAALAWTTAFDSTIGFDAKAPFIADAEALRPTIEAYTPAGAAVGGITLVPTVVVITGDTAAITYDVMFAGTSAYEDQDGSVERVDGAWVVGARRVLRVHGHGTEPLRRDERSRRSSSGARAVSGRSSIGRLGLFARAPGLLRRARPRHPGGASPSGPSRSRCGTVSRRPLRLRPDNNDHLIVRSLRVPRTIVGLLVGAALGVGGAVMQGLTRNPLADPGILGVNAGAALFVVIGIYWFGKTSLLGYVWFAFAGAAVASVLVYTLGSLGREGATPVKLALAGAALTALLGSITTAILLIDVDTLDQFRFWTVGSLAGRTSTIAANVAPFIIVGLVLALACARCSTRWPSATTSPAASASGSACPGCSAPCASCCCAGRRRRPPARSPSSGSPSPTSPGPSPARTTAGSCRTRWCWPRSSCSAPTSSGASSPARARCRSASSRRSSARPCSSASSAASKLAEL